MKKLVIVISFLFVFSLAGCLPATTKQQPTNNERKENASSSEAENISLDLGNSNDNQLVAAVPAAGKKEVKRFYPDSGSGVAGSGVASESSEKVSDPERSFNITPELIAKMHLIDKYNPGICFGMPGPVPQSAIDSLINGNKPLSDFVKQKYGLSSDLEIYNKLKQFQNVQLTVISSSRYKFQFMDGQCCTMTFYQGIIEVSGDKATEIIENKETKNNPC